MKLFMYKLVEDFGHMIWNLGEKLANFGDSMVSPKWTDEELSKVSEGGDLSLPVVIGGKWRVRVCQRIAIFGDYLTWNVGRKISWWAYGKLHNNCFAKAPDSYLYGATDVPPQSPPSPYVKVGCEAMTNGAFHREGCLDTDESDIVLIEKGSDECNRLKKEHDENPTAAQDESEYVTYPPQKRGCEAMASGVFRREGCLEEEEVK
jgi:hypothetical protein